VISHPYAAEVPQPLAERPDLDQAMEIRDANIAEEESQDIGELMPYEKKQNSKVSQKARMKLMTNPKLQLVKSL